MFLRQMGIMDYSLLLFVEKLNTKKMSHSWNLSRNEFKSYDSRFVYHIGIIDFMTTWNINKKMENFFKTSILLREEHLISCIEPISYQQRFLQFMLNDVLSPHKLDRTKVAYLSKAVDYDKFMKLYRQN